MKGWQGVIIIGKHEEDVQRKLSDLQRKKRIEDDRISRIFLIGTIE
jgi:hypothetical protein